MSKPTARELCEAIRTRDDTDAAIIGTNLAARVEKVLTFHIEEEWEDLLGGPPAKTGRCRECDHDWPCPTVRVLNGDDA